MKTRIVQTYLEGRRGTEFVEICDVGERIIQQDVQCTYNVTFRLVHETIVAVEKQ